MPTRSPGSNPVATFAVIASLFLFTPVRAEDAKADAPKEPATAEPAPDKGKANGDADDGDAPAKRPAPDPALKPDEVVRAVMDALKENDEKDSGIAVAFDFASPANQEVTGPLERFAPMVKSPAYAPMLNHKSATYGKLQVRETVAQQLVTVADADGKEAAYVFRLSKQAEGDHKDCWMTDGVIRVEPGTEPGLPVPDDGKSERA